MILRTELATCLPLLIGLAHEVPLGAENITRLQAAVVMITAHHRVKPKTLAPGSLLEWTGDATSIATAAHVVAGDSSSQIESSLD